MVGEQDNIEGFLLASASAFAFAFGFGGLGLAGVGGVAVGLVGDALCFLVAAAPAGVEDEGFADEEVGGVFAGTENEECG